MVSVRLTPLVSSSVFLAAASTSSGDLASDPVEELASLHDAQRQRW